MWEDPVQFCCFAKRFPACKEDIHESAKTNHPGSNPPKWEDLRLCCAASIGRKKEMPNSGLLGLYSPLTIFWENTSIFAARIPSFFYKNKRRESLGRWVPTVWVYAVGVPEYSLPLNSCIVMQACGPDGTSQAVRSPASLVTTLVLPFVHNKASAWEDKMYMIKSLANPNLS